MPHVPTVESNLLDVVALEYSVQILGDELIRNGLAGVPWKRPRRAQRAVGNAAPRRFVAHPPRRKPKSRFTSPFAVPPPDKNHRREIRHLGEVEPAIE